MKLFSQALLINDIKKSQDQRKNVQIELWENSNTFPNLENDSSNQLEKRNKELKKVIYLNAK